MLSARNLTAHDNSFQNERGVSESAVADFETETTTSERITEMDIENEYNTKKSKSVTFFPEVIVREILHVNNYTAEEIIASWYRKSDFQIMKKSFVPIIQKLSMGCWPGDTDFETSRGLEYRTRDGATKRKMRKVRGLMAVLDEQERQWMEDEIDAERIARCYMRFTVQSVHLARAIGQKDRQEVYYIWQNNDDQFRRSMARMSFGNFDRALRIETIDDSVPKNSNSGNNDKPFAKIMRRASASSKQLRITTSQISQRNLVEC